MRSVLFVLGLLLLIQSAQAASELSKHENLRGIRFFYMQIDETFDDEVTASERLDLNDIMELQLRRGAVPVRPLILNQPEACIPLLVLSIDTSERLRTGQFDLVLRVEDHVTIKRNQSDVVATTFVMRRTGRAESDEVETIKMVLRELMADFVDTYREQNPLRSRSSEKE